MNSGFNPWTMIRFILVLPIGASGSNSVISRHSVFTLWKYCAIVMSRCATDSNSLSKSWSFVSFFLENSLANVSQASLGVFASRMCSSISSSIVVFRTNIALPALIFHFRNVPFASSASSGLTSVPFTISHKS